MNVTSFPRAESNTLKTAVGLKWTLEQSGLKKSAARTPPWKNSALKHKLINTNFNVEPKNSCARQIGVVGDKEGRTDESLLGRPLATFEGVSDGAPLGKTDGPLLG